MHLTSLNRGWDGLVVVRFFHFRAFWLIRPEKKLLKNYWECEKRNIVHWWGISCSRRNQPASHRTAAESASQPPHCGKKRAIRKTDVHFNRRAASNSRANNNARGGWRNLAFPADGGISHKSAAAGGISRSRRTAESATNPRRLAEIISAREMHHL